MNQPSILLSVVIPAYNYASTLRRAVESVMEQLPPTNELLVIDDGSTDETPEVLARLVKEYAGLIRVIRKENGGSSSARNAGIRETTGMYLIFLDADDELAPGALQKLEAHISKRPYTKMVIGGHTSVFPDGRRREHLPKQLSEDPATRLSDYLLNKAIICSNGACAMHREVFAQGNYPESFRSAEDIPVFAQALANYDCTTLEETLALIYKHDDSLRHQFNHAKAGGTRLVDEVFSEKRLGPEYQHLKAPYRVKRCLSLFRSAYLAKDHSAARDYYRQAVQNDWRVILNGSYTRKFLRLCFK